MCLCVSVSPAIPYSNCYTLFSPVSKDPSSIHSHLTHQYPCKEISRRQGGSMKGWETCLQRWKGEGQQNWWSYRERWIRKRRGKKWRFLALSRGLDSPAQLPTSNDIPKLIKLQQLRATKTPLFLHWGTVEIQGFAEGRGNTQARCNTDWTGADKAKPYRVAWYSCCKRKDVSQGLHARRNCSGVSGEAQAQPGCRRRPLDRLLENDLCRDLGSCIVDPSTGQLWQKRESSTPLKRPQATRKVNRVSPGQGHFDWVHKSISWTHYRKNKELGGQGWTEGCPLLRDQGHGQRATCGTGGKKYRPLQTRGKGPGALFSQVRGQETRAGLVG